MTRTNDYAVTSPGAIMTKVTNMRQTLHASKMLCANVACGTKPPHRKFVKTVSGFYF